MWPRNNDLDEAQKILGEEWVKSDTAELRLAERIYDIFDKVNLYLSIHKDQRLLLIGRPDSANGVLILDKEHD